MYPYIQPTVDLLDGHTGWPTVWPIQRPGTDPILELNRTINGGGERVGAAVATTAPGFPRTSEGCLWYLFAVRDSPSEPQSRHRPSRPDKATSVPAGATDLPFPVWLCVDDNRAAFSEALSN